MEGQVEGKFTVTLTKNTRNTNQKPNRKGLQGPRQKLKLEMEPPSDTDSTDGSTDDEEDEQTDKYETDLSPKMPHNWRDNTCYQTTDMELTEVLSNEETPSTKERAPPQGQSENGRRRRLKRGRLEKHRPDHSSCFSLPTEKNQSPAEEIWEWKRETQVRFPRRFSDLDERELEKMIEAEYQLFRKQHHRHTATVDLPPGPSNMASTTQANRCGCSQEKGAATGLSSHENGHDDLFQTWKEMVKQTDQRIDQMTQSIKALEDDLKLPHSPQQRGKGRGTPS
ncbi:hypothetical protein ABVT39_001062 [Epinephelus coioides]